MHIKFTFNLNVNFGTVFLFKKKCIQTSIFLENLIKVSSEFSLFRQENSCTGIQLLVLSNNFKQIYDYVKRVAIVTCNNIRS